MTGSDDYVCEHCGEVFESEAGVDMHRERNHGEAGASSSDSEGVTLQLSTSHAIAASFLIGIFVGGFFMGALGGGTTGMFAAPTVDTGGNGGSPSDTGNTGNNGGTTKIDMSRIEMKGEPVLGQKDAPVTMVVYEDFQCPFCKRFEQGAIPKIVNNYVKQGKVKIVWKDFPLTQLHPWAKPAAAAMECVYRKGGNDAFWAVKKKVFDNQNTLSTSNVQSQIISWAAQEGVSESAVRNCLQNGNPMQEVNEDKQEGSSLGVSGTPTAFVNGVKLVGAQPYSRFKTVIENQLQG